jgi:lipopolysaccharide export system protein LptA
MRTICSVVIVMLLAAATLPASSLGSAAPQDKPADVAGTWAITVETANGTGTPSVTLKQDGEKLTGTYSSQIFGEQKVTGTIKGNAISFGFTGSIEGTTVTVTYSGTVDKSTMKGKVTLGELGEGTFTAKKQ